MRLSKVENAIICEIAKRTLQSHVCGDDYGLGCGRPCEEFRNGFVKRNAIYAAVSHLWRPADAYEPYPYRQKFHNTADVSFSRAVHRLILKKHLVNGLALEWVIIDGIYNSGYVYAGGGRNKNGHAPPRLKLLGLQDDGWAAAREMLGPDIGKCERTKDTTTQP